MAKDVFEIRGDPIWYCSHCEEPIYIQDIAFTYLCTSKRFEDTPIKCPSCGHVDIPGEVRNYKRVEDMYPLREIR